MWAGRNPGPLFGPLWPIVNRDAPGGDTGDALTAHAYLRWRSAVVRMRLAGRKEDCLSTHTSSVGKCPSKQAQIDRREHKW